MAEDTSWWNFWSDDTPDYGTSDYDNIGPVADGNIYGDYLDTGDYDSDAWGTTLWGKDNYNEHGHYDTSESDDESFWGDLGDWASSPGGASTILGVGSTAFQAWSQSEKSKYERERAEEKERLQREDQKFKALIELAKLKYGPKPGGSGGGSASRRNELMIQTLNQGSANKQSALNSLAQNYGTAVTRNTR